MTRARSAAGGITRAADLLVRTALLAFVWWALVEGEGGGWPLTFLVLASALWASFRLVPHIRWRIRARGFLRFVPFFVTQSVAGGADVARRAFHPRLPLAPGFIDFEMRLPPGGARLFFVGTISLLPGTLSVRFIDGGQGAEEAPRVRVHLLESRVETEGKLRELEERVGDLFGVEMRRQAGTAPP